MSAAPERTPDRGHWSISEVLSILKEDFPDVTISKIRFLESQGLVSPARTPSGYRKFTAPDLERLKWVLHQQRDRFMPLKVIRERLEKSGAVSGVPEGSDSPAVVPPTDRAEPPSRTDASPHSERQPVSPPDVGSEPPGDIIGRTDLAEAVGLSVGQIQELARYGILEDRKVGGEVYYDEDSRQLAEIAAIFLGQGLEARHLRTLFNAADREAGMLSQVVDPLIRRRRSGNADEAKQKLDALMSAGQQLRSIVVRRHIIRRLDR
ncbi:MAG TPA: MerR family transcriptional regulator [Acidimicrobiales bacterium]